MKKFFQDFKAFIKKGNVLDMAVAVIIGAAFNPIVSSLVNNIIMPAIGYVVGDMDFSNLKTVLVPEVLDEVTGEVVTAEVAIGWGVLIGAVINFVIVALCVFILLRVVLTAGNAAKKLRKGKKGEEPAPEPAPAPAPDSPEVALLKEIRDLLSKKEN
ncbi:MAG: large conductance mechanosensitive channel protein MscL [Clostridia bacterium]|nr:large conductance mechanosensitive channel protein MscL [Clostridia bacterium]